MTRLFGLSLLLSTFCFQAMAEPQCSDVFPDAAGSYSNSSEIEFTAGSARLVGGDSAINFSSIKRKGNSNCSGSRCTSSGQTSEPLSLRSFKRTGSSRKVEVDKNKSSTISKGNYEEIKVLEKGRLSFSGTSESRIQKLIVEKEGQITLTDGVYWIEEIDIKEDVELIVPSGENVTVYVDDLSIEKGSEINTSGTSGQLLFVNYGSAVFKENSEINAFLYSRDEVKLEKKVKFNGSVSAEKLILESNSRLTYQPSEVSSVSFSTLCTGASPPAPSVSFYSINHPATGLTCESSQVTISACADAGCTLLADPVSISFPQDDGSRQNLTFTGQTTVNVDRSTAGLLNLDVVALDVASQPQLATQCSGSCSIDFREAAFVFVDQNNGLSTTLPDIVAESALSRIGLRAIEDNNGVCQAALNGSQTVTLGYDCVSDPASYSPNACAVPLAGVPVQGDGTGVSSSPISLTFNAQGIASLPGTYNDVGRVLLSASGSYPGFSINSGPSGTPFDSIPQNLVLTANATPLAVAGGEFDFQIEAFGAQGVTRLPSYAPAQLQSNYERVLPNNPLSSALESRLTVGPGIQVVSSLTSTFIDLNGLNFSAGRYQISTASNGEVGEYRLTLRDSNYLGNAINSNQVQLGRFIPAYFDVSSNTPRLEAECQTSFSYLGQFSEFEMGRQPVYTISAFNAQNQVTRLYSDSQWRLAPTSVDVAAVIAVTDSSAFSLPLSTDTSGLAVVISNNSSFDGLGEIALDNIQVRYDKPDVPDANLQPFATSFNLSLPASVLTDADGVCYRNNYTSPALPGSCSGFDIDNIGDATQRYGRLSLINSYGSETQSLRVPIITEFYDRGRWSLNVDDSCTAIQLNQTDGDILLQNASLPSQANISSQYTTISSQGLSGTLDSGRSQMSDLLFSAPAGGQQGSIRLFLVPASAGDQWSDFLNFDWDNDGDIDNNDRPGALISFGVYRGNDRLFNRREVQ